MNKNKVEKYKIKKTTKELAKEIKKVNRIRKLLAGAVPRSRREAMGLSQMMAQADEYVKALMEAAPKVPVIELDGQAEEDAR